MKVKTSSGQAFEIPEGLKSDFRFVRAWQDMRSKDPDRSTNAALDLVSIVFSDPEEERRFLESLADETGRIPADKVFSELFSMIAKIGEKDKTVKNS